MVDLCVFCTLNSNLVILFSSSWSLYLCWFLYVSRREGTRVPLIVTSCVKELEDRGHWVLSSFMFLPDFTYFLWCISINCCLCWHSRLDICTYMFGIYDSTPVNYDKYTVSQETLVILFVYNFATWIFYSQCSALTSNHHCWRFAVCVSLLCVQHFDSLHFIYFCMRLCMSGRIICS